jgi:septum formation protein
LDSTTSVRLVLVSASPRRRELLRRLGLPFDVLPSHAAERWRAQDATELACENARRKVERSELWGNSGRLLIGADTIINYRNLAFGKPIGEESARRMLERLSGDVHDVITGVCLAGSSVTADPICVVAAAVTHVRFHELASEKIRAYLDTGEWAGKAGAYAIQERGSALVESVDGDFDNVVGLPITLIHGLLCQHFSHCRFL